VCSSVLVPPDPLLWRLLRPNLLRQRWPAWSSSPQARPALDRDRPASPCIDRFPATLTSRDTHGHLLVGGRCPADFSVGNSVFSGEPSSPLLCPGLPPVASIAQGAEVVILVGPAVLERDQVVHMGFASAHRSPALAAPHRVPEQDPRPSGSPVGGVVVRHFLRRPGRRHPLWSPGGDLGWHASHLHRRRGPPKRRLVDLVHRPVCERPADHRWHRLP